MKKSVEVVVYSRRITIKHKAATDYITIFFLFNNKKFNNFNNLSLDLDLTCVATKQIKMSLRQNISQKITLIDSNYR